MSFSGADPETMDRMAAACVDGANVLVAQADALKVLRGWLFGPSAVVAIRYLRQRIVPMLERHAEALREMARVLTSHAQAQRDASAGQPVDAGSLPHYRRRSLSAEERARRGGAVQVVGGVIQVGGAVFGASSGWGIPLALVAGGSGVDNVVAGVRTIIDGTPHQTLVHQTAAWAAHQAGASDRAAWWVGFTADTGLGLGSGIGSTFLPGLRLADDAAREAPNALFVGTRGTSGGPDVGQWFLGHNRVGSRADSVHLSNPEIIADLVKNPNNANVVSINVTQLGNAEALARGGYTVRFIETDTAGALAARARIFALRDELADGRQIWGVLGPNCTTAACDVLTAAGVNLPPTARLHPFLLDRSLQAFPYQGGPAAMITTGDILNRMGTLDAHAPRPATTEEQR